MATIARILSAYLYEDNERPMVLSSTRNKEPKMNLGKSLIIVYDDNESYVSTRLWWQSGARWPMFMRGDSLGNGRLSTPTMLIAITEIWRIVWFLFCENEDIWWLIFCYLYLLPEIENLYIARRKHKGNMMGIWIIVDLYLIEFRS